MDKFLILFKEFGARYPLAIYGLLLTTCALLVESPVPGMVIMEEMRFTTVIVGCGMILVSLFRPRGGE